MRPPSTGNPHRQAPCPAPPRPSTRETDPHIARTACAPGPGHPRARKTGRRTPPSYSKTAAVPGAGGWLRSVSNVPDQPLPKSRSGWSGTKLHSTTHPKTKKKKKEKRKIKVKIKIKFKVKTSGEPVRLSFGLPPKDQVQDRSLLCSRGCMNLRASWSRWM